MTRDNQKLQDNRNSQEGWRVIAERVSKEQDPLRLTELADELIHALNEETKTNSTLKENAEEEQSGLRKAA